MTAVTPGRELLVKVDDVRALLSTCRHDGGFDRELGPIGCNLDADDADGCVCAAIASGLTRLAANPSSDPDAMANVRAATLAEIAKPDGDGWQPIETCPKADYKSYYLFNGLWEDGWSGVQRANWFDGVWIFDSGLSLTDCETKFNPVMWHPDTTPKPPSATGEPKR